MERLTSLPSRPLTRRDIDRLRGTEALNQFIELESRARSIRNGGLKHAVALVERTVVAISFGEGEWERTVLARDADKHQHLTETLAYLGRTRR